MRNRIPVQNGQDTNFFGQITRGLQEPTDLERTGGVPLRQDEYHDVSGRCFSERLPQHLMSLIAG